MSSRTDCGYRLRLAQFALPADDVQLLLEKELLLHHDNFLQHRHDEHAVLFARAGRSALEQAVYGNAAHLYLIESDRFVDDLDTLIDALADYDASRSDDPPVDFELLANCGDDLGRVFGRGRCCHHPRAR